MERLKIPRHIDDPPQVLFFSLDEFVLIFMFMVVGVLVDMLLPAMFIGIGVARLFKKFQEGMMPGLLYHLMWWIGIVSLKGRVPTGFIREIYE